MITIIHNCIDGAEPGTMKNNNSSNYSHYEKLVQDDVPQTKVNVNFMSFDRSSVGGGGTGVVAVEINDQAGQVSSKDGSIGVRKWRLSLVH